MMNLPSVRAERTGRRTAMMTRMKAGAWMKMISSIVSG
jgi:hypothetical protein